MKSLPHEGMLGLLDYRCGQWGGRLVRTTGDSFTRMIERERILQSARLSPCPFNEGVALDWRGKTIYYHTDTKEADWPAVLHEMGHVFATTEPPDECNEIDWFVWEYMIARECEHGKAWFESNRNYGIGNGFIQDFGDLDVHAQMSYLADLIPAAIQSRRLNWQLQPQALR